MKTSRERISTTRASSRANATTSCQTLGLSLGNMLQNADKHRLMEKEALAVEIQEGETTEVPTKSILRYGGMLADSIFPV